MKFLLILLFFCLFSSFAFSQINTSGAASEIAMQGGIGLGSLLAVVISWERNHSILWAIFHAICGWLYVIYFIVVRKN
ncbi:MAG: hypothetical protein IT254_04585 [Chitinophagaceae bacterium]|nr:hypothetical protein [Bacteroidota bacterium]MCC6257576.1 hypothetical protein [Chitinophagaceae bacterium]MCW5916697.1 hypothetical protein [Ferruginibacter sp.]